VRCDRLRRVLVVVVAGLLFLSAALFSQEQNSSPARSGRLSLLTGKVMVKRPGAAEAVPVQVGAATVTSLRRAEIRVFFNAGRMQVRVQAGSVLVSAYSLSMPLEEGKSWDGYPSAEAEVAQSHARVVRLSYVSGTVMLKRPGAAQAEPAVLNTPIQEGFEISTSGDSYAEVEFENGSTARLGKNSKLLFHRLALDADGDKLNGMTFEQGYATFHFLPKHNGSSSAKGDGDTHSLPTHGDVYRVKIADATVTADGKCQFRTDLEQDTFRVEVFQGSANVATSTASTKLGEGQILAHKSGGTESAFYTRQGIVKDAWDRWTEARDKWCFQKRTLHPPQKIILRTDAP